MDSEQTILSPTEATMEKPSEEEQALPLFDKIEMLDKEIRLLHDFCLKSGLNSTEIQYCAEPLLKEVNKVYNHKKWWTKVLYLSLIVAFIAVVFYYEPTYRYICIVGKLATMKLLPYWNWTGLFNLECFVENPFLEEHKFTTEDCRVCRKISGARLTDVSSDVMAEKYLFRHKPVIVTDVTKDWPMDVDNFNINTLKELYLKDVNLDDLDRCSFDSHNPSIVSLHSLFSNIDTKEIDHWQGYWENCDASAAKALRKYYRRPYFLPPMAESAAENWVFVSYSANDSTKWSWDSIAFGGSATWITQIKGKAKVVLTPQDPCHEICKEKSAVLHPGETLVFSNQMWYFRRRPVGSQESISIASFVSWDER